MVMISISEIVPPPIGTAVTRRVAIRAIPIIWATSPNVTMLVPNKHSRNIILKALPIDEPSLWKLVPRETVVSAMSSGTPIFLVHSIFTGTLAADEQVPNDVKADGIIFFQNALIPFLPAAI